MKSPLVSEVLFHLGPLPVSRQVVVTWALITLLVTFCALATRNLRLERPGRLQLLLEWYVELVERQIRDTIGRDSRRLLGLVGTLFLFILTANLSMLVPANEPPTSSIETDAALALLVLAASVAHGIRARGLSGYLRSFARPSWLMIPLNLIEQLTRTFSLMVRLFGNIMSGVFIIGIVLSLAGLFVPIPFMALHALTGLIQAYIFTVLAMVFIGAAVNGDA